jgi:hypothetical protein
VIAKIVSPMEQRAFDQWASGALVAGGGAGNGHGGVQYSEGRKPPDNEGAKAACEHIDQPHGGARFVPPMLQRTLETTEEGRRLGVIGNGPL